MNDYEDKLQELMKLKIQHMENQLWFAGLHSANEPLTEEDKEDIQRLRDDLETLKAEMGIE